MLDLVRIAADICGRLARIRWRLGQNVLHQYQEPMLRKRVKYFGFRRHCPVCSSWLRAFLPLPAWYAENARRYGWIHRFEDMETLHVEEYLCPVCQASDRERLYVLYLNHHLQAFSAARPLKFLDIAPATALRRRLQADARVSYRCTDLFMPDVDDRADITRMSCYKDGQFDFICCSHVLEHVPNDQAALRELFRVLAPSGQAILMVPIALTLQETLEDPCAVSEADRWRLYGQADHVRAYSKKDFCSRIAQAGFHLEQLSQVDFPAHGFARHGIAPRSLLYLARKAEAA